MSMVLLWMLSLPFRCLWKCRWRNTCFLNHIHIGRGDVRDTSHFECQRNFWHWTFSSEPNVVNCMELSEMYWKSVAKVWGWEKGERHLIACVLHNSSRVVCVCVWVSGWMTDFMHAIFALTLADIECQSWQNELVNYGDCAWTHTPTHRKFRNWGAPAWDWELIRSHKSIVSATDWIFARLLACHLFVRLLHILRIQS